MPPRVILIHPAAPAKPALGAACNGCGVCCVAEPCPLGMLLSRRRSGRCAALLWNGLEARHGCGAVVQPARWLRWLRWLPRHWTQRLVLRWIGAARGCDSDLVTG